MLKSVKYISRRAALCMSMLILLTAVSGCGSESKSVSAAETDVSGEAAAAYGGGNEVDGITLDDKSAVVIETVADIYIEPDVTSERVSQALYNQPVSILDEKGVWTRVRAVDGTKGWIRTKFIDRNEASIIGGYFSRKLVVTSRDKVVTSYPDRGATLKNVVMGTEFFSFNESGDAYEVYLPGSKTGWIKGSGLISLKADEDIPLTKVGDFVATALKFKGASYQIKGMSEQGIDSSGLVYISARVNGLDLPRTLEGQLTSGSEIKLEDASEGDLIFVAPKGDRKRISSVGICTGGGSYITASKTTGYVTICKINEETNDGLPAMARRVFPK